MFKLNKKILTILLLSVLICPCFAATTTSSATTGTASVQTVKPVQTTPLAVVSNPKSFLNKNIIMDAKFDKFSVLGLDYKKAFRDSAEYIGFMVQRDDVVDHNVPLSELKLFIKRDYAEKFVDLNTGDKISITGVVFSNALGDAWVDISNIQILQKAKVSEEK